jgi:hypothetical protein
LSGLLNATPILSARHRQFGSASLRAHRSSAAETRENTSVALRLISEWDHIVQWRLVMAPAKRLEELIIWILACEFEPLEPSPIHDITRTSPNRGAPWDEPSGVG